MNRIVTFSTLLTLLFCTIGQHVFANYMRIQNVSQNQTNGTVTFDIAWNNSWRIDGIGAPNHWDAAWVFVKWRECDAMLTTGWTHGLISATVTDHTFGTLQPTLSDGSAVGIDPGPNNTGVMLRQNTPGIYPNRGVTSVTLALTNFPATGDYDVRVFGIEMVYVPTGPYVLGGYTENDRLNRGNAPFVVTSDTSLALNYHNTSSMTLPDSFPKGYDAFYCMKYEITQGQYAAFLNTLNVTEQSQNYINAYNSSRNRLNNGGTAPNIYFSDRPDRAQNYIAWTDLLAYMDWAALRPMTELEYEKACRGNGPYVGGYAWGSTSITEVINIGTPEDGTELVLTANANAHFINNNVNGGDGGSGPIRVGMMATSSTDSRVQTGASYYGIMELSGNVWEQCVRAYPDPIDENFDGQWGDGYLDANGFANVPNWPRQNVAIGTNVYLRMGRGGAFTSAAGSLRVGERPYYQGSYGNDRSYDFGGRGVR